MIVAKLVCDGCGCVHGGGGSAWPGRIYSLAVGLIDGAIAQGWTRRRSRLFGFVTHCPRCAAEPAELRKAVRR